MTMMMAELFKKLLTKRIAFGVFCLVGAVATAGIATSAIGEENAVPRTDIGTVRFLAAQNKNISGKYRFADSKFIKAARDKNSVQTEVGEAGSAEFKPDLTVSKWNGEASFKVRPDISMVADDDKELEIENEQINYKTEEKNYVYYDDPTASENGGFEFKIILNEKPETNTFSEAIESNGVEFYPQLPLNEEPQEPEFICTATECKNSEGRVVLSRAEDVVDSIAVYANGKSGDYTALGGMNYGTGKVAQIKRVKAIDANGDSVYCKQTIAGGIWTKTCPQDFLDNAAYPVVIDPTFGYTTAGSSFFDSVYRSFMTSGGDFYTGVVGRGSKISVYAKKITNVDQFNGIDNFFASIYTKTGNYTGTKLADGNTNEVPISDTTAKWWDVNFVSSPLFDATDYRFVFGSSYFNHDPGNIGLAYDTAGVVAVSRSSWPGYPNWPNTYSGSNAGRGSLRFSIYVTYNAGLAPVIIINNPTVIPAKTKTITANAGGGTLTMSNTTGSICDGTLTFITYASQTFGNESDNGVKVCYRAVGADGTAYLLSNAIAGIDATPPIVTGLSDDIIPTKSKTWNWGANEPATFAYYIEPSFIFSDGYVAATSTSQTSGDGLYYIHVLAMDAVGNESDYFTVSAILDNAAPEITIVNPNGDAAPSKTVTAQINEEGTISMSNTTGLVCDDTNIFIAYSSQTFTSEGDNGAKICYRATDTAGNTSYLLSNAIAGIDATGPTITGLTTDTTPVKVKTWNWSSEPGATFRFVIDANASSTVGGIYNSTTTAAQSSGDGNYYLHVQASDAAGNESSVVTVAAVLDNTPPVITVTGDNPASVEQGLNYTDAGATVADNIDNSISVAASGSVNTLVAGDYTITYDSADSAGNVATSKVRIIRVVAPVANEPEPVRSISGQYASVEKAISVSKNLNDQFQLSSRIQYLRSEIVRIQKILAVTAPTVKIAGSKYSCSSIFKNLSYGITNELQVTCLQEFLKYQGAEIYPEAMITGNFFGATKAAVIRFQERYQNEIFASFGQGQGAGIAGPKTRAVINRLMATQ